MTKFSKLGLNEPLLKAIEEQKIDTPTEIQEKTIPLILKGKDVIGGSSTGSGKTLAFGAGIIQNSKTGSGVKALILTPTRELAEQIKTSLKKFSKYSPLNIVAVYGGVSINPQIKLLRTADVVVSTPGRTLDHLQQGTLNLSKVNILVLDEADRMLEMGFIDDVERIIRKCPKERQTMLFSATISKDIVRLSSRYMKDPTQISARSHVDPTKLAQIYYNVDDKLKFSALVHLLKHEKAGSVMVFCNTKRNVDFVANNLKRQDIDAHPIHGGLTQARRSKILEHFHSGKVHVLVCTDVAARGLDIPGVTHVYNYDIPRDSKQYIHRIGRTARAGKEGMAISLLAHRDYENFDRVLKETSVKIKKVEVPKLDRIQIQWKEKSRFGDGPRRFGGHSGRGGPRHGGRGHHGRRDHGRDHHRRDSGSSFADV